MDRFEPNTNRLDDDSIFTFEDKYKHQLYFIDFVLPANFHIIGKYKVIRSICYMGRGV